MNKSVYGGFLSLNQNELSKNKELKDLAGHYCAHEFNILGSGWRKVFHGMKTEGFEGKNYSRKFGKDEARKELPEFYMKEHDRLMGLAQGFVNDYAPIDWQIDFKSGFRFNAGIHHSELKYGVVEGVDAKVSADLGRLYQLVTLAKAHKAFGGEKHRNECLAQLMDFIASNPSEHGAAWRANMNVSIRIANIIAALDILGDAPKELEPIFNKSFADHGNYIFNNLEFPQNHYHPNHFIANLAGLLMVSGRIKSWHKEAVKWHEYAIKTISEEILNQSCPDGTNFENATSYHCLVLEMLSTSLVWEAKREGQHSPVEIREWMEKNIGKKSSERLKGMFDALQYIIQPNGLIPLIGDNDSGRFLLLEGEGLDKRDWRFLSVTGAELYEDASLLSSDVESAHLMYAETLLGVYPKRRSEAPPESKAFSDAGYYIMKTENDSVFINCGPIGTGGKGGHSHNDKLALTLCLDGKEIFVDPGIYVYTASRYFRNRYRSAHSHNTLLLNDWEQNRYLENSPWWGCHEDTKCECLQWKTSESMDIFEGRHSGFMRFEKGAAHRRKIAWKKLQKQIEITDFLDGGDTIPGSRIGFNLHPDCVIVEYSQLSVKFECHGLLVSMESENGAWFTEPFYYSPEYGSKIYSQRLVLDLNENCRENTIKLSF